MGNRDVSTRCKSALLGNAQAAMYFWWRDVFVIRDGPLRGLVVRVQQRVVVAFQRQMHVEDVPVLALDAGVPGRVKT